MTLFIWSKYVKVQPIYPAQNDIVDRALGVAALDDARWHVKLLAIRRTHRLQSPCVHHGGGSVQQGLSAASTSQGDSLRQLWLDYHLTLQCVGYFPSSGHGMHFDREQLRQAAQLGLAFDLDFYYVDDYEHDV
jgi:hypothetical protein